jgi:hypothetical protein
MKRPKTPEELLDETPKAVSKNIYIYYDNLRYLDALVANSGGELSRSKLINEAIRAYIVWHKANRNKRGTKKKS